MINIEQANIYLANTPVDFRKSIDGLSMIVSNEYNCNPGSGDVYVFYNKNKDKLKMIYYRPPAKRFIKHGGLSDSCGILKSCL